MDAFALGALAVAGALESRFSFEKLGLVASGPMRRYAVDRGIPDEEVQRLIRQVTARLNQMEDPE